VETGAVEAASFTPVVAGLRDSVFKLLVQLISFLGRLITFYFRSRVLIHDVNEYVFSQLYDQAEAKEHVTTM